MSILHPHDYELLQQIFFPHEKKAGQLILFCAGGDCSRDLDLNGVAGVIGFGKTKSLPGMQNRRFHFIKNSDGSIRWLFPSNSRKPDFLKLYNGSGWRGKVFRLFFKIIFAIRLGHLACAGSMNIFYRKENLFDGLLSKFDANEFAMFTGTVGENRKAIFALTDKNRKGWFFKMPLTESSQKLVNREQAALHEMNGLSFEKIEVPRVREVGSGVLVSNVRPNNPENIIHLQTIHFQALSELSNQTKLYLPLSSLSVWKEIGENLRQLKNCSVKSDLLSAEIKKMAEGLERMYDNFDAEEKWPTSISHGDFTPWNMYLSENKVHLYDWELSVRQPLLFDAFHFIFQSGILIEKIPFEKIWERINILREEKIVVRILGQESSQFNQFYQFYILRNVSYYLVKYVKQSPLHEQAHWLVKTWSEAVEHILEKYTAQLPTHILENENG